VHYSFRVPLDYHNESLGTANLAVARYRATNTTARIGTLFTNPGGPGGRLVMHHLDVIWGYVTHEPKFGSGVSYIYRAGSRISGVVDGRYDIVGHCICNNCSDIYNMT
jgi:hypothetical protein